jgi:hypothetical protein
MKVALPYDSITEGLDVQVIVQDTPDTQATAIFWFASTLVDEVSKTDANSMKQ